MNRGFALPKKSHTNNQLNRPAFSAQLLALTASFRKEIREIGERAISERGSWPSTEEGTALAGRIADGLRRHKDCELSSGDGCLDR